MTERTLRAIAMELAGTFYEFVRSAEDKVEIRHGGKTMQRIDPAAFRKSYPTEKDYLNGTRHGRTEHRPDGTVRFVDDGSVTHGLPAWVNFYDMARKQAVEMLSSPLVHDNLKEAISEALIEDREKQIKQEMDGIAPLSVAQRQTIRPK